jgi:hypothetical protein
MTFAGCSDKIVQRWLAENHIKTINIEPGSP